MAETTDRPEGAIPEATITVEHPGIPEIGPIEDVRVELAFNYDEFQPADLGNCGEPYTVNLVWYGDVELRQALREGAIDLHGPRHLCDDFPSWLQLNMMAEVPRQTPARRC